MQESVRLTRKGGIYFVLDEKGKVFRTPPWMGSMFAFLYDRIMERSVFPGKFRATYEEHYRILQEIFKDISGKRIIEFAAGSGDAIRFIQKNNSYVGVDISPGLLRQARKKFDRNGREDFELYVADACQTPFREELFDVALCNLSLNFFPDPEGFISELHRILRPNGTFYCSIPVPERKRSKTTIHGRLYALGELRELFEKQDFRFSAFPFENGALAYFQAVRG